MSLLEGGLFYLPKYLFTPRVKVCKVRANQYSFYIEEIILKSQTDIDSLANEIRDMVFGFHENNTGGQSGDDKNNTESVVIALKGDLGAGKTTFTKAFAKSLGITESITSPTFVILKKYEILRKESENKDEVTAQSEDTGHSFSYLIHIDAYRLHDGEDLKKLGFENFIHQKNIIVIEWPEIVADILPEKRIEISFDHMPLHENPDWRKVTIVSKM